MVILDTDHSHDITGIFAIGIDGIFIRQNENRLRSFQLIETDRWSSSPTDRLTLTRSKSTGSMTVASKYFTRVKCRLSNAWNSKSTVCFLDDQIILSSNRVDSISLVHDQHIGIAETVRSDAIFVEKILQEILHRCKRNVSADEDESTKTIRTNERTIENRLFSVFNSILTGIFLLVR